ncbi:MAG: J domain-containing protein [Myxococcota bacterium]
MSRPPPNPLPESDDPYVLLDVRPGAKTEQIRRAYLRRIKIYKPDRHPAEFRRIREAYDRLREREAWFDAWRQAGDVIRQAVADTAEAEADAEGEASSDEQTPAEASEPANANAEPAPADEAAAPLEPSTPVQSPPPERTPGEPPVADLDADPWRDMNPGSVATQDAVAGEFEMETPGGDFGGQDHPLYDEDRPPAEPSVGEQVVDLACAVHEALDEDREAEAADLLLATDTDRLAGEPLFATLLLEVSCAVVWTAPRQFQKLSDRYGDLIAEHDTEYRDGALLHRRTLLDELPGWRHAVREWPELERFVAMGSSLRAVSEAELGLRLGKRASTHAPSFLAALQQAARVAPGIVTLFVAMAERWATHYGKVLGEGLPADYRPTLDEAATAVMHSIRTHRAVRWKQALPILAVLTVSLVLLVSGSLVVDLVAIAVFLVLAAWRASTPNVLEKLYLQVVQPAAATWLWVTTATPTALAQALDGKLPGRGSWVSLTHPVDIHAYPRIIDDDLVLLAFALTRPMVPRLRPNKQRKR